MNNDELIAAGHELAKCLDNEPLIDIAKLLSKMATQLDVTTLALREKTKQCEQLAAENAVLKDLAKGWANATDDRLFEEHGEIFHDSIDDCEAQLKTICPATDAFIAEQRAQGVEMFADFCRKKGDVRAYCFFNDAALNAEEFAAELRKGGAA
ncbi:hypothetical protein ACT5AA_000282 [Cronobacter sakazakii]|nr:hypothetical protein [Cronobacter sakazakii]